MINKQVIPPESKIVESKQKYEVETANGKFNANKFVHLRDLYFPEFDKAKRIYGKRVQIFDNPNSSHDIILGRDYLLDLSFIFDFNLKNVRWGDHIVPLR